MKRFAAIHRAASQMQRTTDGSTGVEYAVMIALIVAGLVLFSWELTGSFDGAFQFASAALTEGSSSSPSTSLATTSTVRCDVGGGGVASPLYRIVTTIVTCLAVGG